MSLYFHTFKEPSVTNLISKEMKEKPIDDRFIGMMSLTKKEIIALYALAYDRMERMVERNKLILDEKNELIDNLMDQIET